MRETELDEVARRLQEASEPMMGGQPHVERPPTRTELEGALCFLNGSRLCGPDCTAFTMEAAPTPVERCVLLTTVTEGFVLLRDVMDRLTKPPARAPTSHIPPPSPYPGPQPKPGAR
jgi:hypothetical protein